MPIPKEIDFGFKIDTAKLWLLDLPVEEMSISELLSNLDIAYLDSEGTDDWNLTLRDLILTPEKEPSHFTKITNASLIYPIDIYWYRGDWRILDGVHRFCKAILENKKTIMVRKVPDINILDIVKNSEQ